MKVKKKLEEYKKKWKKYLSGTEKLSYPSFMDPKLHPNGMCMICCNANKAKINKDSSTKVIRNFEKCLIHKVDIFTENKYN